ncbi:MAG: chemotaxis protein CheX [Caldithrix sp.]|nr:chemotaxis protein CheX [Caldithrix sp.]
MHETDLHFFIDSTNNYFKEITGVKAETGIPYIKGKDPIVLEYTGIIGISGKRKGSVYITADSDMLGELSTIILGSKTQDPEMHKDLIGEIANTISGNVREAYGADFLISVPVVVKGFAEDIKLPEDIQSFVIPLNWQNYKAFLVVCLE